MATLNEITEGHSKRISAITMRRDSRLRDASEARDRRLRAMPACAALYRGFDDAVGEARARQETTAAKAEGARSAALQQNSDTLSGALADAQNARREADVAAFEKRRQAEADAEREFLQALAAGASQPNSAQAQKVRAEKMEKAKKQFDQALADSQEQFRKSRDAALVAESRGSGDAERAFVTATKVSDSSANAARAAAEQALAKGLAKIEAAAVEVAAWKTQTAAILADYKREESEEFERFHDEMEALRT